jgi:hypothetical protein
MAAGAAAVARAEGWRATAAVSGTRVLLVPGLSGARLSAVLSAFAAEAPGHGARVAVADHLPADLDPRTARPGTALTAFEHLSPMDELLAQATPRAAVLHRVRRLRIILARRGAVECLWAGAEAEDIVRAYMAEDLVAHGALPPPLATRTTRAEVGTVAVPTILFRPIAFRD